jgi:hypothetical protein
MVRIVDHHLTEILKMRRRVIAFQSALAVAIAIALLAPSPAVAQPGLTAFEKAATALAPKGWTPPRTSDGQPDLQGIWTSGFITPVERPTQLADKPFISKEEAVAFEARAAQANSKDLRLPDIRADLERGDTVWMDPGSKVAKTLQTSLVVDPPDGRIPPLTPEVQRGLALEAQALTEKCAQPGVVCPFNIGGRPILADGPEDRPLMERCISRVQGGPPMMPGPYNNNYHIVQNPDFVLIFVEQMHEARVIPLNGRPHLAGNMRELMGDPRGHWEGNTLVVDSTNFSENTKFRNAGPNMHLIERFTRTDPDTLLYEFTVDDPTVFTKPWSAAIPMASAKGPLLEDQCNEGNYGLAGILRAARFEEKKKAEEAAGAKTSK